MMIGHFFFGWPALKFLHSVIVAGFNLTMNDEL
jgi:hypothetical protein